MKYVLLFVLPASLFLSCKKTDSISTEEVRLLQTKVKDGNGDIFTTLFDYDTEGRIIRISHKKNNDPSAVYANISYSGNEATIVEAGLSIPSAIHTREIKYTLDGNNKPLTRIELRTNDYKAPNQLQRDFYSDTATYTYGADGLLVKITGNSRDSVWYKPSYEQTSVRLITYTANYSNTNGNLAEMTRISQDNYHTTVATTTLYSRKSLEEKNTFEYTKAYPNGTDFKNAFLLEEFGVIMQDYPLNKNYRNLPDKVTASRIEKDGTGRVTYNESGTGTLAFSFNKYGFLNMIGDRPVREQNKELIYSH